mmetsp:Transcript_60148/g.127415  ORF Transcript_60148/g.127415 Transcript_60148/m.127415 type:complete len:478 (-) Transcript_60148:254-1687(-)
MSVSGGRQTVALSRRHRMMAAGAAGATRMSVDVGDGTGSMAAGKSTRGSAYDSDNQDLPQAPVTNGPYAALGVTRTSTGDKEPLRTTLASDLEGGSAVDTIGSGQGPKRTGPPPSFWRVQCDALGELFLTYLNLLLIFVPIGQYCHYTKMASIYVFVTNFLAIIPLASLLGGATEAISAHTNQIVGGLLNATFGNAVEMIMCVQAVRAGLIQVVQGNLLGSILSNLLLVLGMSICASGLLRKTQRFNADGAAANMTCQAVASISVCLPTMFKGVAGSTEEEVLMISRVCSIFLMAVYGLFLFFQLKTHSDLFADEEDEEAHEENLSPTLSIILLFCCTLVVAACSDSLVDSIEDVSTNYGLPKAFIGTILLPIVGNAAEHATAVTCAYKGMMDLALGVAVGSCTQIALFVVPCAVMFGWVFDQPMNLAFRNFDTACQMLSVFLVSQVLQHGNTNWLHGAMLMTTYSLIAVITWFIPE